MTKASCAAVFVQLCCDSRVKCQIAVSVLNKLNIKHASRQLYTILKIVNSISLCSKSSWNVYRNQNIVDVK